jgi:hypothetical protein
MNPSDYLATGRADLAEQGTPGKSAWRRGLRKVRPCLCAGLLNLALLATGCTSLKEFVDNGFKVGPNYERPPAPLAEAWIDAANPRVKSAPADYSA